MEFAGFKYFDECDFSFRNSKGKVRPASELPAGIQVADTHCHLGMLPNASLALARAAVHDVDFICCVTDPGSQLRKDGGNDDEDTDRMTALEAYDALPIWRAQAAKILEVWREAGLTATVDLPTVRYAVGVHPHNAKHWNRALPVLEELLGRPETSCLGEIGLDYHYDLSPRDVQREVFAAQLCLAEQFELPVSLHLREAHGEALDILRAQGVPSQGCILHCFNLGPEELRPFLDLGCYIAFGGPLTFKKSWATRQAALMVPVDRLLTETDAPFMAPEPVRGTVCTPDQTTYTLRILLDCFGYDGEERAYSLLEPRQSEIDSGEAQDLVHDIDFAALRHGMSEAEFAERVYRNALDLLDRERG